MENIPWSPKLQRFYDQIELTKLMVCKHISVRSSMTKIRRLACLTRSWHVLKVNLASAKTLLNDAFKAYKEAREQAPEWRDSHLDKLNQSPRRKKQVNSRKRTQTTQGD
jgi:hypothetical protein